MKISAKTVFATILTFSFLSVTAFTANAFENRSGIPAGSETTVTCIQKIVVRGNADISLIQGEKESVKILDAYDSDLTSVKLEGTTLIISSDEDEPVHMTVYVKEPFRIEASNTSHVQTHGKFHLQFLQVILNDQASADVNASTNGLYTIVRDNAKLKLSGSSEEHILMHSRFSKVQMSKFACLKTRNSKLETLLTKDSARHTVKLPMK